MKKTVLFSLVILLSMLLIPLIALPESKTLAQTSSITVPAIENIALDENVNVSITESGKIEKMSVKEYLFGVVAGEMPALYEKEALKAQTVCAYTFLKWRQKENYSKNYDITDDYTKDQCYINKSSAIKKWGSKAEEYSEKIENAIAEVYGETLNYKGEIILSVYHSISSGYTESAENVWGKDYPYLKAVSSEEDKLAENYISTCKITVEDFKKTLNGKTRFGENAKDYFSDFVRTPSAGVKSVKIGDTVFTGSDIRTLFNLKSINFDVTFKDNCFIFTVYGYGHGVGMSQNGANCMAKNGSTYEEILKHYYTDCEINKNS